MACIKGPTITPPTFPLGLSLTIPNLPVPGTVGLCCQIPIPFPSIPSLPAIPVPAAAIAAINAIFLLIDTALDAVQISCPAD